MKTLIKAGQSITMDYDYMGRRIRKTVTGTGAYDIKFLWTGWKLAAELAADGETINKVFVWGRDFSDVQGNAGGAGSLLAQIAGTTISYAVPDAYGTIVGYITSANGGKLVAAVEYSPYGKGVNAAGNWQSYPIGFSGQYMDWEPGLVYYGRRHYAPKHGRFINRDPIEEQGGNNLYGFVNNSPYRGWDVLGLDDDLIVLDPIVTSGTTMNVGGFKSTGEETGYLFTSGFFQYMLDNWFGKWQPTLTYGNTIAPVAPISPALKAALNRRARAPNKGLVSTIRCHGVDAGGFHGNVNDHQGLTTISGVTPGTAQTYQNFANGLQTYGPPTLAAVGITSIAAPAAYVAGSSFTAALMSGGSTAAINAGAGYQAVSGVVTLGGTFTFEQGVAATGLLAMQAAPYIAQGTNLLLQKPEILQGAADFTEGLFVPGPPPMTPAGAAGGLVSEAKSRLQNCTQ